MILSQRSGNLNNPYQSYMFAGHFFMSKFPSLKQESYFLVIFSNSNVLFTLQILVALIKLKAYIGNIFVFSLDTP